MLRISKTHAGGTTTLAIEGKLQGPWVNALRSEFAALHDDLDVELDLEATTYVDRDGVEFLRERIRSGVRVGRCSSFIRELLFGERSES